MIQKTLAICLFLLSGVCLYAQNTKISISYDNAGNRVKREVINLSNPVDKWDGHTAPEAAEDMEEATAPVFNVYPNPTKGRVTIAIEPFDHQEPSALYVVDLSGRVLYESEGLQPSNVLDFSAYSDGTYILKIMAGEHQKEWTVIKQ